MSICGHDPAVASVANLSAWAPDRSRARARPDADPDALHMTSPTHPPLRSAVALVAMLIATTALSQFYRASTTVIAPELIRDLALTPAMLGFANACFFLALLAIQVPVGILFDRIGARLTVTGLAAVAVGGSLLHGVAADGDDLALARFIVGLGHGGSFMSTIFLISRWYPPYRWSTALSWVFSASMIGILAAGPPLALSSEWIGWRSSFVGMAVIQGLVGLLFLVLVTDDPPGAVPALRAPERLGEALRGFWTILVLPGLLRVMSLQVVAYAVLATMMGLWAGPYMHDVHGLTPAQRGNVLAAMAVAQFAGVLVVGPLDRVFDTRKWVSSAGAVATIATLLALAAAPQPPLAVAIALLVGLSAVSAYGVVVVAHGRSFYPEALAGRGTTTFNMAQLIGCALMPMLTGLIPALFPLTPQGYSPVAYQVIFASIALALAVGLGVYASSRDVKPSEGRRMADRA
jgi:MFS family permease